MSALTQAHEIPGGSDELDATARRLFGKSYIRLDDSEAGQVWDALDPPDNPEPEPSDEPSDDYTEPDLPPWQRSNERQSVWEAGGNPDDPAEYEPEPSDDDDGA